MTEAAENPWYLLATLHGEVSLGDVARVEKNRIAWNRYMAERLSKADRDKLIDKRKHSEDELTPFSVDEKIVIEERFKDRLKGTNGIRARYLPVKFPTFEKAYISFSNVHFKEIQFFDEFIFPVTTYFNGAIFSERAVFRNAFFSKSADFRNASFSFVWFNGAIFSEGTEFNGAIFSKGTQFDDATFSGDADFADAKMLGETSFRGARFAAPPRFFGTTLHEGTHWHRVRWPDPPAPKDAERFVGAYERLKLEMDRLKKHRDELDFFAREMQCQQVLDGPWKGLPISLYGLLSDYGCSYVRPLCGILATTLVGALPFWLHFWQTQDRGYYKFKNALGLSLVNTLGVLSFGKDFLAEGFVAALPSSLKFVIAMQTIIGTVLMFLFGLALRNRLRMK